MKGIRLNEMSAARWRQFAEAAVQLTINQK